MKNKLTKISLVILLTAIVCMFTSCKKKLNDDAFIPYLDTLTKCKIQIAGRYQNFEALEAEFDRFNEYYSMEDGSLPMVPVLCAANGMLVNEDLFKKEGIEIPTNYRKLVAAKSKIIIQL